MTSEEKLLNLIRKEDKQAAKKESKSKAVSVKKRAKIPWIGLISTILVILIVVLGYFLFEQYQGLQSLEGPKKISLPQMGSDDVQAAKSDLLKFNKKGVQVYLTQINERDYFLFPWEKEMEQANEPQLQPQQNMNQPNDLKIVGIIMADVPQVIIEDKKENLTSFLSVGDEIGGAVVSEILPEKVLLKYDNQVVELMP